MYRCSVFSSRYNHTNTEDYKLPQQATHSGQAHKDQLDCLTINMCPQTNKLCFLVIADTKSVNAGLFLGNPDITNICGLKNYFKTYKPITS